MPQPTPSDVHVDAALTNISVAFIQDASNFVAEQVFPTVPVDHRSDKYFVYDRAFWNKNQAKKRAPATESAGSGFNLSTDSYLADVWAFHKDVDDQTRANADPAIDVDADATRFVTQTMLITRETEFASTFFATGVWTTDKVGAVDFARWDDEANSDPIEDVKNARLTILESTGMKPNRFVMGIRVFEALKKHPLVLERYKYTSAESITEALLANLFEVERVVVASAIQNTANEGATAVHSFIMGKNALLCYAAPAPGLMQPSAGYIFAWRGLTRASGTGVAISNFRIDKIKSNRVEGEFAFDMKKVSADLGYFFSSAVS